MKSKLRERTDIVLLIVVILVCIGACKKDDTTNGNGTNTTPTDADGNTYGVVVIGTQTWMATNLKTTKYNDDSPITLETNNTAWINLTTAAYCWYDNDMASNGATYGALYNWFTVETGKLCPSGWRVPSDADWDTLTTYLGGLEVAGGKLKEVGISHWDTPNNGATNESGFKALPSGIRNGSNGSYELMGRFGYWLSNSEYTSPGSIVHGRVRGLYYLNAEVESIAGFKQNGSSVRCIKN